MPYLQVDLEAIKRAFQAAPVAGLTGQQVLGGLNCLWAWAWQEKQDLVTRLQLESIFGGGSPRLAEALAAFGFLDVADGDQFRVKGSDRYLRLAEARASGARATNAKLGRTSDAQATQVRRTSDALTPIHRYTDTPIHRDSRLLSAGADVPAPEDQLVEIWNSTAASEMPRCQKLTESRRKKAKALLDAVPIAEWPKLIANANASDFCRGRAKDNGWKLSLAGMLARPELALKVLEGNYANGSRSSGGYRDAAEFKHNRPPEGKVDL